MRFGRRPRCRRYLWDDAKIPREVVAQVVESHLLTADEHGFGHWALHVRPTMLLAAAPIVGFCGFRLTDDGPEIELMYGLQPEYWGKGLATEARFAALYYLWR
ncbi:MAG: GNAT family N-acetyltransferase [Acidobacteriaceae bacterium]|nr:GNAT family N-acetyltransferase [Acidobacteriaceae bacterium]